MTAGSRRMVCDACNRDFPPREGGVCSSCGRTLCGWHLAGWKHVLFPFWPSASTPCCVDCRRAGRQRRRRGDERRTGEHVSAGGAQGAAQNSSRTKSMRLFRHVLVIGALAACSQGSGVPPGVDSGVADEHTKQRQTAYLDSLRRDAARRKEQSRMRVLDEPPNLVGTVLQVPEVSGGRELLVEGARPDGAPSADGDQFRVVLQEEGAVWRQNREPLPLDSLRPGDHVVLWAASGSVAKFPVRPATLPVRAIMRLDQPLPGRRPASPTSRPAA